MPIKTNNTNTNKELVFPELSYAIVGAAFAVFNSLGPGHSEKVYQNALAKELEKQGVNYKREVFIPVQYRNETIAKYFADFVVEEKIIVELKVVKKLGYTHARQVLGYLQGAGIRLGILVYFTEEGVKYRRVLNSHL
ncbi:MAG: GxxExxY protein [Patescibacteria group bacterium]